MPITIADKIKQDITLLQLCLENRYLILKQKNRSYKMDFWNRVHEEYNKIYIQKPKNIKQLRDRFKYLFKNFEKTHCVDLKLSKNLSKGNFIESHKTLVDNFIEIAELCFHRITYNSDHVITLADDFCTVCYSKKYPNLTEEDFKQMNAILSSDNPKNQVLDLETDEKISYKSVFDYELNKVSNKNMIDYASLDVENASDLVLYDNKQFDLNSLKEENESDNSTMAKQKFKNSTNLNHYTE